jgi:type II secretory pathway pseudopilin PulG
MNYCLRCNKPCSDLGSSGSEPSVFCDECRAVLRKRLQPGQKAETAKDFDLLYTTIWQEEVREAPVASAQAGGEEKLVPNTGDATERRQSYNTFPSWRSQDPFVVKPLSESSMEAALAVHPPLNVVQITESGELPEVKESPPPGQADAKPKQEEDSSKSFTWSDLADPLMARIDTYKFPSPPVEEGMGNSDIGSVYTIVTPLPRGRHKFLRIAFMIVTVLVVLALVAGGMLAAMSSLQTQQNNAKSSTTSSTQTATTGATQLPSATGQAQAALSPAASAGVGNPTVTTSTTPGTTAPSQPQSPIEGISASTLNFNAIQGQSNPGGQTITIANTGGAPFDWTASADSSWLSASPGSGTVAAGQTGQVTVKVKISGLTPDSYNGKVTIQASDSSGMQVQGSPQVVSVTLTVAQPCTLQVTPGSLTFNVKLLAVNSPDKNISLTATGKCAFPVSFNASADQSWIVLSVTSGSNSGGSSTVTVHVNTTGMLPGHYTGYITFSAVDNNGTPLQDSSQTISVNMTVTL